MNTGQPAFITEIAQASPEAQTEPQVYAAEPAAEAAVGEPVPSDTDFQEELCAYGQAFEELHSEYFTGIIEDSHVFAFFSGVLVATLLWILVQTLKMMFRPRKSLTIKMDDGTREVITAKAMNDLQRIASRDLGTAKRPKIRLKQRGKNLIVHATLDIYENQKGPEMKRRLEENLRREFQAKHGLDVAEVQITVAGVREGQGPTFQDELTVSDDATPLVQSASAPAAPQTGVAATSISSELEDQTPHIGSSIISPQPSTAAAESAPATSLESAPLEPAVIDETEGDLEPRDTMVPFPETDEPSNESESDDDIPEGEPESARKPLTFPIEAGMDQLGPKTQGSDSLPVLDDEQTAAEPKVPATMDDDPPKSAAAKDIEPDSEEEEDAFDATEDRDKANPSEPEESPEKS